MSKYLLTCQCGKTVPVDVGQAGGRVTCVCGAQLEVPTLRKLRHMPIERPAVSQTRAAWSPRKGFVAAGLIVAGLLVASAIWSRFNDPVVPKFDPVGQTSAVNNVLEDITPVQAWKLWVEIYRPRASSGFAVYQHPHAAVIEQSIAERRFLQKTLIIAAAIIVVIALSIAFWPSLAARR